MSEQSWWERIWLSRWYGRSRAEEEKVKEEVEARRRQLEHRLQLVQRVMERRRA